MAYFDCARTGCFGTARGQAQRERMGCRLPDMRPGLRADLGSCYDFKKPQGLWEIRSGRSLPALEDEADGCPGSWYRSRFSTSFVRYQRSRAEGGVRVANPLITPDTDELILDALRYFEREQEAAEGRYMQERHA